MSPGTRFQMAMTRWRQWLELVLQRTRPAPEAPTETKPHARSAQERAHFWAEFRAGQREADERVLEAPNRPNPATR